MERTLDRSKMRVLCAGVAAMAALGLVGATGGVAEARDASSSAVASTLCRYRVGPYNLGVYRDNGGKPYTQSPFKTIAKGTIVSAYKNVVWSSPANVQFRKLGDGNWGISSSLQYLSNQTCLA
jgi:hypothetical protein